MAPESTSVPSSGDKIQHQALVLVSGEPNPRYDPTSALLHWLIALLVVWMLALGWLLSRSGKEFAAAQPQSELHVSLGLTTAVLVLVLLIWRIFHPAPPYPAYFPRWRRFLGGTVHFLIYLLVLSLTFTGYLEGVFSGNPLTFWGQALPAWGWEDPALVALFSRTHRIVAWALAVLIVFHIGYVLVSARQYPRLRSRMMPSWKRRAPAARESKKGLAAAARRTLSWQFRVCGWLAFWSQLSLGLICVLLLVIAESSSDYAANVSTIGPGLFWANLTMGVLFMTIVAFFYYTRIGSRLLGDREIPLSRQRVMNTVVAVGALGLVGIACAMGGMTASMALLIAKTISQPPGIAITDPSKIIRALDIFVLLANFDVLVAHFVGFLMSLWLFNRTYLSYRPLPDTNLSTESQA